MPNPTLHELRRALEKLGIPIEWNNTLYDDGNLVIYTPYKYPGLNHEHWQPIEDAN